MRIELLSFRPKEGFKGHGSSGRYSYDFSFSTETGRPRIFKRGDINDNAIAAIKKNGLPRLPISKKESWGNHYPSQPDEIVLEEVLCDNTMVR